ncbi:class I SAM-dependent methyltransferase [Hydrogenovibrio halophilus]|uniref:class I SAM-dependent methyltransferase n=1 Tax=Hydrogenovibrio halophilus TaxID=373391 RepID=UPI00037D7748|nr:class I SAM-dependent methyltransferase [Hydrogenovibrio halophilus]
MAKTQGFDQYTEMYDQWFTDNPHLHKAEIAAIETLMPTDDAGRRLEIGCGSGQFMGPLKIDLGVEPSKAMRQRAEQRGLTVKAGSAEALPLEDASYDWALFVTSLCFVDDPMKALTEAHRVLGEDGQIVIAFLEKNSELGRQYEAHKDQSPFYKDATFMCADDVLGLLGQIGFHHFDSVQTLTADQLKALKDEAITPSVMNGHDEGAFVVIKAQK